MLSSRIFWKLLLACAGLNLVAAIVFGTIVAGWQERQLVDQVASRLRDAALLLRNDLAERMPAGRSAALQQYVGQLGEETGMRLTLVAMDGTVLADSAQTDFAAVAKMENHRNRPEIFQAITGAEGASQRRSETLGERYSFFALLAKVGGKPVGVVRAAITLTSIERQTAAKRRLVWILAAAVFLCVSLVSYWVVGRIIRPIASITAAADAIAKGDYQQRLYVENRDELGRLAGTLNRMCQELDARMTQLSQSHQRQATVLGGMIEGVIAVDHRERVLFANAAAGRLFDFRPLLVEGRRLLEVVRNHALDEAVTAALATGQPQRLETNQEGSEKMSLAIQATPLPGDPCPGVVLVMHETTELRRLESLRQEFMANVSHELKTPLSSIKAYAETLQNGALDDREASVRFVERILEQADRLQHLIFDMLTLARIESEQEVFDIVAVPVSEVVDACFDSYRAAADAKRIQLVAEPPPSACRVLADAEGLREILDNLVDNAIKYTPEGGNVDVRWRVAEDANFVEIEVADSGIGIPQEGLPRVFERFYRVDKARSRELGGTGLGLAIVKHLVQSFGGNVIVESQKGKGSTFIVELPLSRP
jgi:two-component system phosphate regulon sensor histidine kinase PhoR